MADFEITPIQNPNIEPEPPIRRSFLSQINMKRLIIVVVVVFIAAGVYFWFFGRNPFSETKVDFKIDGPNEISSGELVTYKITYSNSNKQVLKNAKLLFIYPTDAVVVRDGNISNTNNENIELGDLAGGQSGEKSLTAHIIGDRGDIKTAKGTFSYTPTGIHSAFQKQISVPTTITSLDVPLSIVAPPSIIDGQNLSYIIDYRNQSQQDFENLRLKIKYPQNFQFSSALPQPTTDKDTWDLPTLKRGSGSRITIQGIIRGSPSESKIASLTLQKKIITPAGEVYIDFEKTGAESVLANSFLSLSLGINDSTNYTTHLGDNLNYQITFKNNSSVDITGLNLTAILDGPMFEASSVNSAAFFDSRTNTITWNPSIIPELALLRSGQKATANFSVRIKNNFPTSGSSSSLVKVKVHLETPNIPPDLDTDNLAIDTQLLTRISSAPTLDQKILVNDGQFGSNGPFPPKVNSKTYFTVRWILVNPVNDISQSKVSAVLAPGVTWENQVRTNSNQPAPTFNPKTNSVVWDLGTLPGGTGVSFPKYQVDFRISIIPSVNQVGQTPTLLKNIKFEGTDAITGEKISRTVPDATTINVDDSSEQGSVQP